MRGLAAATTPWLFLVAVTMSLAPQPAAGQSGVRSAEARLLREAAARESRGDYAGAADALRRLLAESPESSGGIFALERVLRAQGQLVELLPPIEAYLAVDPDSPGVRSLGLRVLTDVDSLDAMRRQAEAWIDRDPREAVAYREIARVYEDAFGPEDAMAVLRRGRDGVGSDDAFALEIGDLLVAAGDRTGGAVEWAAAVGDDGGQTAAISRRLSDLSEGRREVGRLVVAELAESDRLPRRTAAARLALDLGLSQRADELVRSVARAMDGRARSSFLADAARRAREKGMVALASWAYDELGDEAQSPAERRQFDQRIVDVALASGDTTTALEAQWRLVESYSPRSVDRRRATARAIELEGGHADPGRLTDLLAEFRQRFENAPELDGLAATVAAALHARGDEAGAEAVLEGVNGPRSSLERGYLLLGRGELEEGRTSLLLALTGLPPSDATGVIQFTGLLGRISAEGAEALAAASVRARRGEAAEAAMELAEAVRSLPSEESAPLLAEAGRIAAAGGADEVAAAIRSRLVEDHPGAVESAEAALELARHHATKDGGVDEAIRLLEDLIARRPNAAVVPDARLELQRLRSRGSR
ncbi:MAG: hypothetical protein HKN72_01100 [Gemmatimonadetes bacterium]|nr:hypothetical protein [Gemmatimonadota bacterium]